MSESLCRVQYVYLTRIYPLLPEDAIEDSPSSVHSGRSRVLAASHPVTHDLLLFPSKCPSCSSCMLTAMVLERLLLRGPKQDLGLAPQNHKQREGQSLKTQLCRAFHFRRSPTSHARGPSASSSWSSGTSSGDQIVFHFNWLSNAMFLILDGQDDDIPGLPGVLNELEWAWMYWSTATCICWLCFIAGVRESHVREAIAEMSWVAFSKHLLCGPLGVFSVSKCSRTDSICQTVLVAMFSDMTSGRPRKPIRMLLSSIPSLIGLQPDRLRWEWLYWRERAAISPDSAGWGTALGSGPTECNSSQSLSIRENCCFMLS